MKNKNLVGDIVHVEKVKNKKGSVKKLNLDLKLQLDLLISEMMLYKDLKR